MNMTTDEMISWLERHGLYFPDTAIAQTSPARVLLKKAFYIRDREGNTGAHWACIDRTVLPQIRDLLEASFLAVRNKKQETPIHWAAQAGTLELLPSAVLTDELLNESDQFHLNAFHHAARLERLRHVPSKFLTPKNLLTSNLEGVTPLDCLPTKDLDLVADFKFSAPKCVDFVREVKRLRESAPNCEPLARFANAVSKACDVRAKLDRIGNIKLEDEQQK